MQVRELFLDGDRGAIRQQCTELAFRLVLALVAAPTERGMAIPRWTLSTQMQT